MADTTLSPAGTAPSAPARHHIDILQTADFFQSAGLLHPLAVGSIGVVFTYVYLRLASNRATAPITVFDSIVNVALGGVLAGLMNGNNLTQGLIGLCTLLGFQKLSSWLASRNWGASKIFQKPGLIVIFRGQALTKLIKRHKISECDLNQALRLEKIWNISEVEACVIEPTGVFTVYKRADYPTDVTPDVLLAVPGYRALCEAVEEQAAAQSEAEKPASTFTGLGRTATRASAATHVEEGRGEAMQVQKSVHSFNSIADRMGGGL